MLGTEDRFVDALRRRAAGGDPSIRLGIGDDGAVVSGPRGDWVFSVDACVEGIHFDPAIMPLESMGSRALGAALSDLAAMGATPRYYLVSVEIPSAGAENRLRRVYKGFSALEHQWKLHLIGGNVSRGDRLSLHTTVIGELGKDRPLTRSGARPGDGLYVTGTLGESAWGLRLLKDRGRRLNPSERQSVQKFLRPSPRIDEARFLLRHRLASAGMDISDGLLLDLSRLCRASGVGAALREGRIPRPQGATEREMLTGGEDYELLVAVRRKAVVRLSKAASRVFHATFKSIGVIEAAPGVRLHYPDGRIVNASRYGSLGWDHWKS